MSSKDLEEAVDYVRDEHEGKTGREFESSVREALSALGFDTHLAADGELKGEVVNSYDVETDGGRYALEIRRDSGQLNLHDRT